MSFLSQLSDTNSSTPLTSSDPETQRGQYSCPSHSLAPPTPPFPLNSSLRRQRDRAVLCGSNKHRHGNKSCSQPCCHQEDQQIQPTTRNSHLHSSSASEMTYIVSSGALNSTHSSSLQWPVKQAVPGTTMQLSWPRNREVGRATDITGDSRETTCTCSSNCQWLCKRGTNAISFQNTSTAG